MSSSEVRAHPMITSRYELLTAIASGGMATVYVGLQKGAGSFQRIVAIKRLHEHIVRDPEVSAMFRDEAQIASLIQHPNVVAIHDVYLQSGEQLLVMEYVEGVSLGQLRRALKTAGGRIPRAVAVRIVVDALRGLHAAHELRDIEGVPLKVVHRDATPQNILVGVDGNVKVADFGIARAAERSATTRTGHVKGKYAYMAPEQIAGREVDRRADVFAMGAVLWELLANRHMFRGEHDAILISQISSGRYPSLCEVVPDVPKSLEAIVMKAASFRPEDRFPTAQAFADTLEEDARGSCGLAAASEVSATVLKACGESLQSRRHQIHEIIGGRAPKVSWLEPRVLTPGTDASSYAGAGGTPGLAPPLTRTPRSPLWRPGIVREKARWIAVVGALILVGLAASLFAVRTTAVQPAPSVEAPVASPGPKASSPASRAPERVSIRIEADDDIVELRAPDSVDLDLQGRQASFSVVRSDKPFALYARLADGTELNETVRPEANALIKLRRGAAGGTRTVDAAPKRGAAPGATRPASPPPNGPAPGAGPALKYENNPY